jgi:hypothetical protein
MATTFESLTLSLELMKTKGILKLLETAEPLLTTANEYLLSILAWSETYSWYQGICLEELELRLQKVEQQNGARDFTDWDAAQ